LGHFSGEGSDRNIILSQEEQQLGRGVEAHHRRSFLTGMPQDNQMDYNLLICKFG
jgi:hypothetical protein